MAKAGSKSGEAKNQTSTKKKLPKRRNFILLLIVILLVLAVGLFLLKFIYEPITQRTRFEHYLNEKYGRVFMIENIRREGAAVGMSGDLVADATPNNDDTLRFRVWESQDGTYHSTYLQTLLSREEYAGFQNYVTELSIKPTDQYVDIKIPYELSDRISNITNLKKILEENGKEVTYGVAVKVKGEEPNTANIDDVVKLIEYVQHKNNDNYTVRYVINSNMTDSRYYCQYYGTAGSVVEQQQITDCFKRSAGRE